MDELVGTYFDEWKAVVDDPERQKQFRQFVNTVSLSIHPRCLSPGTGRDLHCAPRASASVRWRRLLSAARPDLPIGRRQRLRSFCVRLI